MKNRGCLPNDWDDRVRVTPVVRFFYADKREQDAEPWPYVAWGVSYFER